MLLEGIEKLLEAGLDSCLALPAAAEAPLQTLTIPYSSRRFQSLAWISTERNSPKNLLR